jgi:hypothetical protein
MSGLGDSRRSSSRASTADQFVADTRSAMDLAQSRFGCEQFVMVGFCSGGDIAHAAALQDNRLRAIVLWDSYVYPTRRARLRGFLHRLRRHTLASAVRKVGQRLGSVLRSGEAADPGQGGTELPSIFGRTQMPPRDDFGKQTRSMVDRGVELFFIFSGGEPEWYNYQRQFHEMYAQYGFVDRVAYAYLIRSDHTFIQPHAQSALVEHVEQWLEQRALPAMAGRQANSTSTPEAAAPAMA